ncbi:phosphotransferase [Aromatoleum anaerobium]|uniref:phosphotransferase n=1 Tax=Aromatoleum anaerobium TaxID=182180 RepID=UPI001B7CE6D5|nr:phosphotransferase [Aromatoleum anaerobium]MCK0507043.1 toluene tolerance protein [Aromatoleum anaerobium]
MIESDRHGEKVLLLPDGTYLKLFRRKRLLSSAAWHPYAQRFADNAAALARHDIPCPQVIGVFRFPSIDRDAVHYRPLHGQTLRQLIRSSPDPERSARLRVRLGAFIAELHSQGIYFRSLHLGNVVIGESGAFGLIDIADLKVHRAPLSRLKRRRNFRHMFRYAEDRAWLLCDGGSALIGGYLGHAPGVFTLSSLRSCLPAGRPDS